MIVVLVGLAMLCAAAWIWVGSRALAAARSFRTLAEVLESERGSLAAPGERPAALSVVVTARDEAAEIETTVRGLRSQTYPGLEVVVVDDRSSDGTGEILDRLARQARHAAPRLRVIHCRELPPGWLGKCHACRLGAEAARGEWLLFTDGDVSLGRPDLLERTVAHAERCGLDHVAVTPDLGRMPLMRGALLAQFGPLFLLAARAWEMERDLRRGGAGVGAFNLVRRAAYERIGGHRLLRMEPADDLKLGRLLKLDGARQRLYGGLGLVRCDWHRGALGVIRGLEKNFFAGCAYSLPNATAVSAALLSLALGPPALAAAGWLWAGATPVASTLAAAPLALQVGFLIAGAAAHGRRLGFPGRLVLLQPLGTLLLLAALWNSALRTLARGGVRWRDTFYPLAELRRGLVRVDARPGRAAPAAPRENGDRR